MPRIKSNPTFFKEKKIEIYTRISYHKIFTSSVIENNIQFIQRENGYWKAFIETSATMDTRRTIKEKLRRATSYLQYKYIQVEKYASWFALSNLDPQPQTAIEQVANILHRLLSVSPPPPQQESQQTPILSYNEIQQYLQKCSFGFNRHALIKNQCMLITSNSLSSEGMLIEIPPSLLNELAPERISAIASSSLGKKIINKVSLKNFSSLYRLLTNLTDNQQTSYFIQVKTINNLSFCFPCTITAADAAGMDIRLTGEVYSFHMLHSLYHGYVPNAPSNLASNSGNTDDELELVAINSTISATAEVVSAPSDYALTNSIFAPRSEIFNEQDLAFQQHNAAIPSFNKSQN